jgi:hypothetical protein
MHRTLTIVAALALSLAATGALAKEPCRDATTGKFIKCAAVVMPATPPPAGATALCKDNTYSMSKHHAGSCSKHGGVAKFL